MGQSALGCGGEDWTGDGSDSEEELDKFATSSKTGVLREICVPKAAKCVENQANLVLVGVPLHERSNFELTPDVVLLHVYDLRDGAIKAANHVLTFFVEEMTLGGAFHAGVEVYGSEWSYGTLGVECSVPRAAEGHAYRCSVYLGRTTLSQLGVAAVLHDLCHTWLGNEYELLGRNCCSFSSEFCDRLGVGPMPGWVDRFARILDHGRYAGVELLKAGRDVALEAKNELSMLWDSPSAPAPLPRRSVQDDLSSLPAEQVDGGVMLRLPGADEGIVVRNGMVTMMNLRTMQQTVSFAAPALAEEESPYANWNKDLPISPPPAAFQEDVVNPLCASDEIRLATDVDNEDEGDSCPRGGYGSGILEPPGRPDPAAAAAGHESPSSCAKEIVYGVPCEELDAVLLNGALGSAQLETEKSLPPSYPQGTDSKAARKSSTEGELSLGQFPVGAFVEYESSSQAAWISATVLAFHPDSGLYDLSCKPQVPVAKIRWPEADGSCTAPQKSSLAKPTATEDAPTSCIPDRDVVSADRVEPSVDRFDGVVDECKKLSDSFDHRVDRADTIDGLPPSHPRESCSQESSIDEALLCTTVEDGMVFPVGANVEYLSASLNRWVPARVVGCRDGLYDLTCKPQVPVHKIRWPCMDAPEANSPDCNGDALRSGSVASHVENPQSHCGHDVKEPSLDSVLQMPSLECQVDAPILDVSPFAPNKSAASFDAASFDGCCFPVGSAVEYESASQNRWVPAVVRAYHADSALYDLDCKAQVPRQRIRWPIAAVSKASACEMVSTGHNNAGQLYPLAASVEYDSASHGGWVPAKVLAFHASSCLYDLSCKPQVPPQRIRLPFPIGSVVEYQSLSMDGKWVPAKVIAFDADSGLYDLDCKPTVPPLRLRPRHSDDAQRLPCLCVTESKMDGIPE